MIGRSADHPQDRDRVQSQVITRRSTSPKPKAHTTAVLGDSIVKNVYCNIITKSVKHQKHVVVKLVSRAKIADRNHYEKPAQEKSPVEIIIHVSTSD